MGLSLALSNALSGINVSQQSLATVSGNITNANTEGYSRKINQNVTLVSQGVGVGADPVLKRIVDDFLTQAQRNQTSSTTKAQVVKDYMDRVQAYLGSTDSSINTTIMSALDNFFTAVSNVAASPDQPYLRTQAVNAASSFATTLSTLSNNLQETRYQADQEIAASVRNANDVLDRLATINKALRSASIASQPQDELMDQRDKALKDLTQYLDVGVTYHGDGQISLFNQSGELLSPTGKYHLSYTAAGSVDTFKNDKSLGSIDIVALTDAGVETGSRVVIATSGKSTSVTSTIADGKILGLLQIRDSEMPKMLEQLDSLANGLRDAVNKIHNNGIGFPPPESLTGTRLIPANREVGFEGSVRIAALDVNGKPVASPYSNDEGGVFRPLKLDFGKIYGPTGIGKPSVADIMKEVNQYYGPPADRVSMGSLSDTKLVAISDNTTGPFQFDLQFDNPSANALTITIVSVNSVASGVSVSAAAGEITRTAPGTTFSIAGAGPYSIPVEIMVTDPVTGITYHDTINYTVPAAASGARGDRYSVASLVGSAVAPENNASIVTPTNNNRIATAQMVDASGNPITNSSTPAFLQLLGNNGTRIGIDELTSNEVGVLGSQIAATGKGFSEYFQMNDFFAQNSATAVGSAAANLKVKQSLVDTPSLMSIGKIFRSSQPTTPGAKPLYTYELGISSNGAATILSELRSSTITFAAAGSLPSFTNSVLSYASEIYSYAGGITNTAISNLDQQKILQKSYDDRADSVSGVNLDEELANTVLFQNAYSASARMISVVSTLFETLLQIRS